MTTSNDELGAREEEILRQNEELQSQTEELEQQAEELRIQAEELQNLSEELSRRESTLQMLLQLAGPATSEPELLHEICAAAPKLLGEGVLSAAILERSAEEMVVRSHSDYGPNGPESRLRAESTLAEMAIERGQVAQLEDTRLRPDLLFPLPRSGETPRSVLSAPLRTNGGPPGALEAYAGQAQRWTDQLVRLLEWLAGQCSRAWENARLRDELARGQDALRASERRYRSFVEVTSQYAWVTDAGGQVVEDVPALRSFTGQTYEQAQGTGWADALHPDDVERTLEVWSRAVAAKSTYEIEYRMRRYDGVYRLLLARGVPILDEQGKVVEWVGTCVDVTERKRAEETLRESELFYHQALDSIPGMVFTTRPDGYCDYQSQRWVDYTGVPMSEHLGDGWNKLLHPEDRPRAYAAWQAAVEGHAPYDLEYRVRRHDGEYEWFKVTGRPIRNAAGEIVRWFGTALNVNRLVTMQEALRESEEQARRIIDNSLAFVGVMTPDGTLVEANATALRAAGVSREEVVGRKFWDCYWWSHDAQVQKQLREAVGEAAEGRIVRYDVVVRMANDSRMPIDFMLAPVRNAAGQVTHLIPSAVDITERKAAENALREAKAAAEAANVAKGRFLANMSHELRTPMNAILGMIDVALPKAVDPTVRDCLQTAKGSADLLLTLVDDLLDSAKIESGKLELESAPFSLRRMLDQITRILSVRASEMGLCFYCRVPGETPDVLVGDRTRLQQVLLNLAGNAIKFTEHGEVEIQLHSSLHDGEASLQFAVRDTGIGIAPANLARLFEPFAQADPSMSRRFGGTGLGLSISKNLVELMGGTILVESELGRGSTFSFTVRMPLAAELPPDFDAPVPLAPAARVPLRILLAEDNPANQKLATYILEDRGHTVDVAGDGQEAVSLVESNRYDAILMDVQMPRMDGLEATAAIRKREAAAKGEGRPLSNTPQDPFRQKIPLCSSGRHVPIIAMTAHAMKGDRERCLAAGMDGYLSKPINAEEMIGLVESFSGGQDGRAENQQGQRPAGRSLSGEERLSPLAPQTPSLEPKDPSSRVFDPEVAISRCFKNRDVLRKMIQFFFNEVNDLFPQMRAALERGDLEEVGRLGHRMKGTVVYLAAEPAKEAARGVERFCKSVGGTASEAEQAIDALEHECIALKAALIRHPLAALSAEGKAE